MAATSAMAMVLGPDADAMLRRRRHPPQTTTTPTPTAPSALAINNNVRQSPSSNHHHHGAIVDNDNNTDDNNRDVTSSKHNIIYQLCQRYDEHAWFIIFLAALSYLIVARSNGNSGGHSRGGLFSNLVAPYEVVSTSVIVLGSDDNEKVIKSLFYIDNNNISPQESDGDDRSSTTRLVLQRGSQLEVVLSSDLDVDGDNNGLVGNYNECTASSGGEQCKMEENNTANDDEKSNKSIHYRQQPSPPVSRPYLSHLTSTTWVHDPELGRGYLLINDVGRSGRIWRWEVGGGPISIGRTLHMERSGCRSGLWLEKDDDVIGRDTNRTMARLLSCPENLKGDSASSQSVHHNNMAQSKSSQSLPLLLGSASIAVEPSSGDGKKNLAVAEWGERRIVRVEEGTGARTPLVTLVPKEDEEENHHDNNDNTEQYRRRKWRRLYRPNHLTYTPTGDLLFSDSFVIEGGVDCVANDEDDASPIRRHVGMVFRKKGAAHIPPISVDQSRDAHGWIRTTSNEDDDDNDEIEILFQCNGWIDGISLGLDHSTLYVLAAGDRTDQIGSTTKSTVYKLRIGPIDDIEEDSEDDKDDASTVKAEEEEAQVAVVYETTSSDCQTNDIVRVGPVLHTGSKLAVDKTGTLYLISCPTTVTLLTRQGQIGELAVDHSRGNNARHSQTTHLTSIGFGEDGYLYLTSVNELMRVKSRVGGIDLPTNVIP